jgi:hypothetical protein
MCTLYDNSWIVALGWARLGVIVLALAWIAYRSGVFADLNRWRRRAVAELALAETDTTLAAIVNSQDEPLTA